MHSLKSAMSTRQIAVLGGACTVIAGVGVTLLLRWSLRPTQKTLPGDVPAGQIPISVGEVVPTQGYRFKAIPSGQNECSGPQEVDPIEVFENRRIVLFAVPGAFTPTCSSKHLPGFISLSKQFKLLGIDDVICTSTNDAFVLSAWGTSLGATGKVRMLADGNGDFAAKMGMLMDRTEAGMGLRSRRYAVIVDHGEVVWCGVGGVDICGAELVLAACRSCS